MKRIIVFAIALGTFSFAANAQAFASTDNVAVEVFAQDQGRTEVTFDELPEAVKTAFQESDYSAQEVQSVYQVASADNPDQMTYEITVTDGTTPTTLIFDQEGNIVE